MKVGDRLKLLGKANSADVELTITAATTTHVDLVVTLSPKSANRVFHAVGDRLRLDIPTDPVRRMAMENAWRTTYVKRA